MFPDFVALALEGSTSRGFCILFGGVFSIRCTVSLKRFSSDLLPRANRGSRIKPEESVKKYPKRISSAKSAFSHFSTCLLNPASTL
ncbi:hypothetical protein NKJ23_28575 [Mesorhizobium sp. M0184]|uniref:hypothetical protein n=1 Tax=Mesorhizobium sp. M0184 TaxID=2956906 RepID=UPI0033383EE6